MVGQNKAKNIWTRDVNETRKNRDLRKNVDLENYISRQLRMQEFE